MPRWLRDKIASITGAQRGQGRSRAVRLAQPAERASGLTGSEVVPLRAMSLGALLVVGAAAVGGAMQTLAPRAQAAPAPEVEYLYNVTVRRHYNFPNNDAVGYGYRICDEVRRGDGYAQVMGDVKSDVTPNDEFAANYLVSYAVNLLCPAEIWQLRNSAAHYQPN